MNNVVNYKQYDKRWAYADYSVKGKERTNIYESGCGPTCTAMVIATLKDKSVTPLTCANWSVAHGYKAIGAGTYNTYFVPQLAAYGIKATYLNNYSYHNSSHGNHAKVKEALKAGKLVIANAGPGLWTSGGHFILAYKIDNADNVYINDPASTRSVRLKNKFSTFAYQMKYYWIIDIPNDFKEEKPIPVKNYLSRGDVNDNVGVAQKMLKALGYYDGKVDNSFGPQMLEAVKKAQKALNLTVDGFYGPKTKKAVERAYNNKIALEKTYIVGRNYKLVYDLKVRKGAGTHYAWKRRTELTSDGQKHAYSTNGYAVLKAGTTVTIQQVKKISSSEVWVKIPSGWLAAIYGGSKYIS